MHTDSHTLLWTEHYLSTRYFMQILVVVSLFSVFVIPAQVNYTLALRPIITDNHCALEYVGLLHWFSNNHKIYSS